MTAQVAILAGGAGSRLRSRTGTVPKPMVRLAGKPLLEHQFALCARHGFTDIVLLLHYGHEVVQAHFGDGPAHGVRLAYHVEDRPRGTAGALLDARHLLADTFLVLYGDTYLDVDLRRVWEAHRRQRADATLFVHPNDHPQDSDLVEIGADGFITALHPYPRNANVEHRNLVNAALYVFQRAALEQEAATDAPADIARHVFPAMLNAGRRLFGYVSPEYIKDVGTPDRLDRVEADIAAGVPDRLSTRRPRTAVFLDRDGTINHEVNRLTSPDQVELIPGSGEAIRRLNRAGLLTVVVTNQAVIARGDLTFEGLDRVHARLEHLLGESRAYIDRFYACPHHPDRGFDGEVTELKIACRCRKPGTALIEMAQHDLDIDIGASWLVGDTTSDIEAGRRAGLRAILVRTGHAGADGRCPFRPDYVTMDLAAAVGWILEGHTVMRSRLADAARACRDARVVLIGGLARSGKSSVAQVLRELLNEEGGTAHVLSLDAWLKPNTARAEGTGVHARFDLEAAARLVTTLRGATDTRTFALPVYDRRQRAYLPIPLEFAVAPGDVVIVEGVPALVSDPLVAASDIRIHVDVPEPQRVERLRADYQWRGDVADAVDAMLASRASDETPAVTRAAARAGFTIASWTPQ